MVKVTAGKKSSRVGVVRRVRRRVKPKCLCSRSLSSSVLECKDFQLVSCSASCRRPQYYLHSECASFYCGFLRRCGFCHRKFVLKRSTDKNLLETVLDQRKKSVHVKSKA